MISQETSFLPFALSPEAEALLLSKIRIKKYKKGTFLLKKGHVARDAHFIISGSARCFYESQGKDVTNYFAFENEGVTSTLSFMTQKPSDEIIQVLEDTTVATISYNDLEALYKQNLEICNLGRKFIEGITIELEERIRVFQITSAQDRYDYILAHKPQIIQRVPLKYLASFLGITAETLSRIRSK
jgi:CRP/FNR family transcriptional regulator, anaerobic regulatory protein